jgi:hypothetical protein
VDHLEVAVRDEFLSQLVGEYQEDK